MTPAQLTAVQFSSYPPQGKALVLEHLAALRVVPLSLLPTLLRDLQAYDWKFPPEQKEIVVRLKLLPAAKAALGAFAGIPVPDALERLPWITEPEQFLEQFTAYLWASHQIDAYHVAAKNFVQQFQASDAVAAPSTPRLVIVVIGRDAQKTAYPLFEKLQPHGQVLTQVDVASASSSILQVLSSRAKNFPETYAHWYVDGGSRMSDAELQNVAQLVYPDLAPVRQHILHHMDEAIHAGTGPEALRSSLARLSPSDLSVDAVTSDPRMQHLAVSLLTEGSGTQIFSTSFVQWSSREVLRRAQPLTLCARYAPRIRQRAFDAMVQAASSTDREVDGLDAEGSLIDADMGAYYTYLEMKKMPQAQESTFLVYVEGQSQGFLAGPRVPAGTRNDSHIQLSKIFERLI
jgi:hypothetical protein